MTEQEKSKEERSKELQGGLGTIAGFALLALFLYMMFRTIADFAKAIGM